MKITAENFDVEPKSVYIAAKNDSVYAMQYKQVTKKFFGLIKKVTTPTRIIDDEGVIRLQKRNGRVRICSGDNWEKALLTAVDALTEYNDGGKTLPNIYVIFGKRIIDLSGLLDEGQILSLARIELANAQQEDTLVILCSDRLD
jgi:hypothetical protein